MTEKEKRARGDLYDANYDKELLKEMEKTRELCYEYNNLRPTEIEKKDELIKKILGKSGKNIRIEPNFYCDYGYNIFVGDNFYMNYNCVILDYGRTPNRNRFKK